MISQFVSKRGKTVSILGLLSYATQGPALNSTRRIPSPQFFFWFHSRVYNSSSRRMARDCELDFKENQLNCGIARPDVVDAPTCSLCPGYVLILTIFTLPDTNV